MLSQNVLTNGKSIYSRLTSNFLCIYFVFVLSGDIDYTLNRGLDEEIRTVVRGQTNIGHEGRQVSMF